MTGAPWTFDEARNKCLEASKAQENAEVSLKTAYVEYAKAQEQYALHLALMITSLRDMGVAATVCLELAKGAPDVAALRRVRDIAEGVKAAAEQACWRRNSDRKDAMRFAGWSERREFAEAGNDTRPTYAEPIGARS